jgi:hypothetical protein
VFAHPSFREVSKSEILIKSPPHKMSFFQYITSFFSATSTNPTPIEEEPVIVPSENVAPIFTPSINELLNEALKNNDLKTFKTLVRENPEVYYGYFIDTTLDEGKNDFVEVLLNAGVKPSLYAVQMAHINGFHDLACLAARNGLRIDTFGVYEVQNRSRVI